MNNFRASGRIEFSDLDVRLPSPMNPTRVRFAPSPTGNLHIGGARTALFNWLFARAKGGKFLLRIEDTDRERSEDRFTKDILGSLSWMGMDWDEEPIFQSHRFDLYREVAERLVQEGKAFRCGYTDEELKALKEKAVKAGRPYRYPGFSPDKVSTSPTAPIRLKMPKGGETTFNDLIRGPITIPNSEVEDWVILRGSGAPTYNFCVVIDDNAQKISHVIRGEDHINNTPKQIHLYHALGLPIPEFAHVPMILGADRQKLSKRHGAASTLEYRQMGYLPGALVNFLVRLGWSHGDQELFETAELKQIFNLEHVGKSNAVFNVEKLEWVSGKWMEKTDAVELGAYIRQYFMESAPYLEGLGDQALNLGVSIVQGKVKTVREMLPQLECLFGPDPESYVLPSGQDAAQVSTCLKAAREALTTSEFERGRLEEVLKTTAKGLGIKFGPLGQSLRFAVTGGKISPGLCEMLEVQGKERVLRRVDACLDSLGAGSK